MRVTIALLVTGAVPANVALGETVTEILGRPGLWSLRAHGEHCGRLDPETRAMLSTWKLDPTNSVVEEGVFGLYNPVVPSQLVVLYTSKTICEETTGAIRETRPLPPQIAWGKGARGLRAGIAITRPSWPKNVEVTFELIVQNSGSKALTIEDPCVSFHPNVRVWMDDQELEYRGPRPKIHPDWRPRVTELAPGAPTSFALGLRPYRLGGALSLGIHELRVTYEGRPSGILQLEIR